jgi:hypothetical protein
MKKKTGTGGGRRKFTKRGWRPILVVRRKKEKP